MSGPDADRTRTSGTFWVGLAVLAVVFYLLSPGIVWVAVGRGGWLLSPDTWEVLDVIFKPVEILSRWGPADRFYNWYSELCMGR